MSNASRSKRQPAPPPPKTLIELMGLSGEAIERVLLVKNLSNAHDISGDKSKPGLTGKTGGAEYNDVVHGHHWVQSVELSRTYGEGYAIDTAFMDVKPSPPSPPSSGKGSDLPQIEEFHMTLDKEPGGTYEEIRLRLSASLLGVVPGIYMAYCWTLLVREQDKVPFGKGVTLEIHVLHILDIVKAKPLAASAPNPTTCISVGCYLLRPGYYRNPVSIIISGNPKDESSKSGSSEDRDLLVTWN